MKKHKVSAEEAGSRLDILLTIYIKHSRSLIQKYIKTGDITVNEKHVTPHLAVDEGDVVAYPDLAKMTVKPKKQPAPVLEVLYEDKDIVVINKPAGLVVHRAHASDNDATVVDGIVKMFPKIKKVGDDPSRPGIVHRLDKDVSGVMVIAKTQKAFDNLKEQFKQRDVTKEYLALVYGQLPRVTDRIDLKIARSKQRGRMVARTQQQVGREAITDFEVLKLYKTTSFVRVHILTGRTHQIRVHFLAIDHPLVGDKLYKKPHMKNIRPIELNRIFLHSHALTIKLMNGEEKTFSAALPPELEHILSIQPVL